MLLLKVSKEKNKSCSINSGYFKNQADLKDAYGLKTYTSQMQADLWAGPDQFSATLCSYLLSSITDSLGRGTLQGLKNNHHSPCERVSVPCVLQHSGHYHRREVEGRCAWNLKDPRVSAPVLLPGDDGNSERLPSVLTESKVRHILLATKILPQSMSPRKTRSHKPTVSSWTIHNCLSLVDCLQGTMIFLCPSETIFCPKISERLQSDSIILGHFIPSPSLPFLVK